MRARLGVSASPHLEGQELGSVVGPSLGEDSEGPPAAQVVVDLPKHLRVVDRGEDGVLRKAWLAFVSVS